MTLDSSHLRSSGYLPRTLTTSTDDIQLREFDDSQLFAVLGPKVVLGEPGMGKSELIREVGRSLGVEPVTAIRFMLSKTPSRFIVPGKPLLIDGLDEAMARRDGDAVDRIVAQLEEVGAPDFILACRSREWQARNTEALREIYGDEPTVFNLQPLTRDEAATFLSEHFPNVDASAVLDHVDQHSLSALSQNPLTLGLLGRVAQTDDALPESRAALFDRVCTLVWREHDEGRQDHALARLSDDQALAAAGAMSAAMLFAGAEAICNLGPAFVRDGEIQLAEIVALPGAEAARLVFSSKLFHSIGDGRASPIHRVVAEFLGARWLALQAATPRVRRRLIAIFQRQGPVPASLRGLHAWLAHHAPDMAEQVIQGDPYGVLLYGETGSLRSTLARCLFDALGTLAEEDPWFRAGFWSGDSAACLMEPALCTEIDAVIRTSDSNEHFRALLIEALKGTELAAQLAPTVEAIILSPDRFYAERSDAIEALLPHKPRSWWRETVDNLRVQGPEHGPRLALDIIRLIDVDIDDDLLVETIFADLGATICGLPRNKVKSSNRLRGFRRLQQRLPVDRIVPILEKITDYSDLLEDGDWERWGDVTQLIAGLMERGIDEGIIGPDDASSVWRWLGVLEDANGFHRADAKKLMTQLDANHKLRRAVQAHVLFGDSESSSIWGQSFHLQQRHVGLIGRHCDVAHFLDRLGTEDNRDPSKRTQWQDLMRLGMTSNGLSKEVRSAGATFAGDDQELADFLSQIEIPGKSEWELKQEKKREEEARKREIQFAEQRRYYLKNRVALRRGDIRFIVDPARAYLGQFIDFDNDQEPEKIIAGWLGENLRDDVMVGFDAVLTRDDLPTPEQVARGCADNKMYHYSLAIMAGLSARVRDDRAVADLSQDVLTVGLLLIHHFNSYFRREDRQKVQDALEAKALSSLEERIAFARLWIEPQLTAGTDHVSGLYMLGHEEDWRAASVALAPEWLRQLTDMSRTAELEIVNCLVHAGAFENLAEVATERCEQVFRNFEHMLDWLAIDVLVRFEMVSEDVQGIGAEHPQFLWCLRNRFQIERRNRILTPTVAQACWIVSEFRKTWPDAPYPDGVYSGDQNDHDASEFLKFMIHQIAANTSEAAVNALRYLADAPDDSYTKMIRHMAAEQRRKNSEEAFEPLLPSGLCDLLANGPPSNMIDLVSLVLEGLYEVQLTLAGDEFDQVRDFWNDANLPHTENRCRDRLAVMLRPELEPYNVQQISEADMPQDKRVDLAFMSGRLQLPMEVKGQWHDDVWDAASGQLDRQYLIDWRSGERGIYCVLWFGRLPSDTGKRLKRPPGGKPPPDTADAMRAMLVEHIPPDRRAHIEVIVLDLTSGRR